MNWINLPRFKIEEEKQSKKKLNIEEFVRFLFLWLCFAVTFWFGQAATKFEYEQKLQDKQTQLNICMSSMDLFKEDFDAFCAERFEKMGC